MVFDPPDLSKSGGIIKNMEQFNNNNKIKTLSPLDLARLEEIMDKKFEELGMNNKNGLNNQPIKKKINYDVFNSFINKKKFKNIFDYVYNENDELYVLYNDLLKTTYSNAILEDPKLVSEVNEYVLDIFKNKNYETMLKIYKQLQIHNDIGCCTFLSIAPLFLAPEEVIDYIEQINNRTIPFSIQPLVNTIINRIIQYHYENGIKLTDSCLSNLTQSLFLQRNEKGEVDIEGLTTRNIIEILENIGLGLQCFIKYEEMDDSNIKIALFNEKEYPTYITLYTKNYFKFNHIEVMYNITNYHFIKDYRYMYGKEYTMYQMIGNLDKNYEQKVFDRYALISQERPKINKLFNSIIIDDKAKMNNKNIIRNRKNNKNTNMRYRIGRNNITNSNKVTKNIRRQNRQIKRNINRLSNKMNNIIRETNTKSVNARVLTRRNNKDVIINGKDLIIPVNNKNLDDNSIYGLIPINPVFWNNTRIKNICKLNQYYLPLDIVLEYVPTVSKFQKGNVTIGCIVNNTMVSDNIENVLIASTSGCSFSCSKHFRKKIDLQSLIQQKKLLVNGKLDSESIPFYIFIYLNSVKDDNNNNVSPGQFFINYKYKFFNPISNPIEYKMDQNIIIEDMDTKYNNILLINTQRNNDLDIGTHIKVIINNNNRKYYVNDREVFLDTSLYATILYSDQVYDSDIQNYDLTNYNVGPVEEVEVPMRYYFISANIQNYKLTVYPNSSSGVRRFSIDQDVYYLIVQNLPQDVKNLQLKLDQIQLDDNFVASIYNLENTRFII